MAGRAKTISPWVNWYQPGRVSLRPVPISHVTSPIPPCAWSRPPKGCADSPGKPSCDDYVMSGGAERTDCALSSCRQPAGYWHTGCA